MDFPEEGLQSPDWANNDELKALNDKVAGLDQRLAAIENLLRSLNSNIAAIGKFGAGGGSSYGGR